MAGDTPRILISRKHPVQQSITLKAAVRGVLAVPVILLLGAGIWSTVRLSKGDLLFRQNTVDSVSRAVEQDPKNGRYYAWLAELLEFEGRDSTAALDTAARLNPMDSRVWIRRGLNAEVAGRRAEAEKNLLHAAEIDRLMEPRWTLMNFYFRQQDEAAFWQWAHQAFLVSYGERSAMFELCWQMRQDGSLIASKALPPDDVVLTQFLRFLMGKGQVEQAAIIAEGIAPRAGPDSAPLFEECVRRLVERKHVERAVGLWNAMSDRGLVKFGKLDPAAGKSLTNGTFALFPTGAPFDWQYGNPNGVSALRVPDGLRLTLSGSQNEGCELLRQWMPLVAGRQYRLQATYQPAELSGAGGVRLRVGDRWVALQGEAVALNFTGSGMEAVVVEYRRPAGQVRAEGRLILKEISLGFAE